MDLVAVAIAFAVLLVAVTVAAILRSRRDRRYADAMLGLVLRQSLRKPTNKERGKP